MVSHVVCRGVLYYVEFIYQGNVVDEAGPFDEEWEAEEVSERHA